MLQKNKISAILQACIYYNLNSYIMDKLILLNDAHFIIDMMYARTDNMIKNAVYTQIGFGNVAYLHQDAYAKLLSLVPVLDELKLKMRICDAYRPPLAHRKMLDIIPRSKAKFFAATPEKSNHCHGTAVDVCLTDLEGNNLIYPSEIDVLSTMVINIRNNIEGINKIFKNDEIRLILELYQLKDEPNNDFKNNSIIFSYSDIGELLYKWDFCNDIVIINIPFHYTKTIKKETQITEENNVNNKEKEKKIKENKNKKPHEIILPYLLICYIEDRKTFENKDLSNIY
jgi:hypothetical protein